jgi:hypothetical protein
VAGFLNPVLASCQLVNVSRPGEEPDMWEAEEDMRLLSDALADKNGETVACGCKSGTCCFSIRCATGTTHCRVC